MKHRGRGVKVVGFCIYWKDKETHIPFGCNLHKRCIVCVYKFVFDMLNIPIGTNYDTFYCEQTTCVSHVTVGAQRGCWHVQAF